MFATVGNESRQEVERHENAEDIRGSPIRGGGGHRLRVRSSRNNNDPTAAGNDNDRGDDNDGTAGHDNDDGR